jgi:hypothetical protein|tara:strand:+ start:597 stop:1439 length:843 start_codon:yes stop_codon:yes gene_type:complete
MNFADYQAIPALNASSIKRGANSMAEMRFFTNNPMKETKALYMGRAFHLAVLEPDEWANVLTFTGSSRNSKAYKELKENHPRALILSPAEHNVIARAADYLTKCPDVQELLAGTEREVSLTWDDAEIGHKCKCRIDAVRIGDAPVVVEVKSARELGKNCRAFIRQSAQLNYHLQLGFYRRGYRAVYGEEPQVKVMAVQLEPFPDHAIMVCDPYQLMVAEAECVRIARQYLECCKAGAWPGVGNAKFDVPGWASGMDEIPAIEVNPEVEGMSDDEFASKYL